MIANMFESDDMVSRRPGSEDPLLQHVTQLLPIWDWLIVPKNLCINPSLVLLMLAVCVKTLSTNWEF